MVCNSLINKNPFFLSILIDKRLALKARLFKTIGCTIGLFRIYSYNAKISPVLLTLLKIYAKNGEFYRGFFLLRLKYRINN